MNLGVEQKQTAVTACFLSEQLVLNSSALQYLLATWRGNYMYAANGPANRYHSHPKCTAMQIIVTARDCFLKPMRLYILIYNSLTVQHNTMAGCFGDQDTEQKIHLEKFA